jgi:hypothetical protein
MNFLEKLVKDAVERSGLKLAVLALSVVSLVFGIMLALDLSRDPIVIDRGCESRLATVASTSQSAEEVEAFLRASINARFDSAANKDPASFLVADLVVARSKEQEDLKKGGVDQRMIVRSVKLDGDHFRIEADRLVAVAKARSAIPLVLLAKVSSKMRSLTNPYGLVVTSVEQEKEAKHE